MFVPTGIIMIIAIAAIAYVIGSIPFSFIFSKKIKGEDIRSKGSGNVGTTNMLRSYGWGLGILTLVADLLKGVLAALVGLWLGGSLGLYVGAVFAVVGHNYSCFLKLKGGKGIATTTGVLLMIQPIPTVIIFAGAVLIVVLTRIMSIGSIVGLIASAVVAVFISNGDMYHVAAVVIIAVLALIGHRENISRLAHGTERKLSISKK